MTYTLFALLLVCVSATVLWALRRPERFYLYPTLCALTILGWATPRFLFLLAWLALPGRTLKLLPSMFIVRFHVLNARVWCARRYAKYIFNKKRNNSLKHIIYFHTFAF